MHFLSSSLLFTDDSCNSNSSEHEEQEQNTEHEIRLTELKLNDPVHKVDLSWYFQTQVSDEIISLAYCNRTDFVETHPHILFIISELKTIILHQTLISVGNFLAVVKNKIYGH